MLVEVLLQVIEDGQLFVEADQEVLVVFELLLEAFVFVVGWPMLLRVGQLGGRALWRLGCVHWL